MKPPAERLMKSSAGEYHCSGSLDTDRRIKRARAKAPGDFVRLDRNTLKFEGHIDRVHTVNTLKPSMMRSKPWWSIHQVATVMMGSAWASTWPMATSTLSWMVWRAPARPTIFLKAGKHKTICRGFVGFHGTAGASKDKGALEESILRVAEKAGMGREQIEKVLNETLAVTDETIKLEQEFYGKLNVSKSCSI